MECWEIITKDKASYLLAIDTQESISSFATLIINGDKFDKAYILEKDFKIINDQIDKTLFKRGKKQVRIERVLGQLGIRGLRIRSKKGGRTYVSGKQIVGVRRISLFLSSLL